MVSNELLPAPSITRRSKDCNIWLHQSQQHLTKRQNGDKQRKRDRHASREPRHLRTRRSNRTRTKGIRGTKPNNTETNITTWVRRNNRTRKNKTKHNRSTRRTISLNNNGPR